MAVIFYILEYITWWFPIFCLLSPVIWAIIYHNWYKYYKERKSAERWERLSKFFVENADKYPEAATSFRMAKFHASPQGYDLMHKIKKAEYENMVR